MYANGEGVKQDSQKARECFQKAAAQGNEDAKKKLDENKNRS
jgi:TPR repeat protein